MDRFEGEPIIEPTPADQREMRVKPYGGQAVRSELQIERDRAYIARMYLSGVEISRMADDLHIEPTIVKRDLAAIRAKWQEAQVRDFNAYVNMQLARIDALEQTYWQAWYDSANDRVSVRTERHRGTAHRMNGAYGPTAEPTRDSKTIKNVVKNAVGNHAFLRGIQWCISERSKLLGLSAPIKIAPTTPDGQRPYDPVSDETRFATLVAAFQRGQSNSGSLADGRRDDAGATDFIPGVATERRSG